MTADDTVWVPTGVTRGTKCDMGTFFVFFGTLLLSEFVALLAALQLADYYRATEEFIAVMLAIMLFAVVAIVVFAIVYRMAKRAGALAWSAIGLALLAIALVVAPSAIEAFSQASANPYTVGTENIQVVIELLVPALVTILIQWGLVRRRYLRARGEDDLTLWPWVSTVIAGFAILNPFGLSIVASAVRYSATEMLRDLWVMVALGAASAFIVVALVEIAIRWRIIRRRQPASP